MASLNELLDESLTVQQTVLTLHQLLISLSDEMKIGTLQTDEMELYTFYLKRVLERNQSMLSKN